MTFQDNKRYNRKYTDGYHRTSRPPNSDSEGQERPLEEVTSEGRPKGISQPEVRRAVCAEGTVCVKIRDKRLNERNERSSVCLKPGTSQRKGVRAEIGKVSKDHIIKF